MLENVFYGIAELFAQICSCTYTVFGVSVSVGGVLAFSILAVVIVKFVKGLVN